MKLTLDEVPADVPPINRVAWMKRVNSLIEKALPGNWAWRTLENDFGFDGDYVYGQDEGGDPAGFRS